MFKSLDFKNGLLFGNGTFFGSGTYEEIIAEINTDEVIKDHFQPSSDPKEVMRYIKTCDKPIQAQGEPAPLRSLEQDLGNVAIDVEVPVEVYDMREVRGVTAEADFREAFAAQAEAETVAAVSDRAARWRKQRASKAAGTATKQKGQKGKGSECLCRGQFVIR